MEWNRESFHNRKHDKTIILLLLLWQVIMSRKNTLHHEVKIWWNLRVQLSAQGQKRMATLLPLAVTSLSIYPWEIFFPISPPHTHTHSHTLCIVISLQPVQADMCSFSSLIFTCIAHPTPHEFIRLTLNNMSLAKPSTKPLKLMWLVNVILKC